MESDRTKLEKLLTEFGVGFDREGNNIICRDCQQKIGGYSGFFTTFEFDTDGEFVKLGAWE